MPKTRTKNKIKPYQILVYDQWVLL